jgi:hypothetical protein
MSGTNDLLLAAGSCEPGRPRLLDELLFGPPAGLALQVERGLVPRTACRDRRRRTGGASVGAPRSIAQDEARYTYAPPTRSTGPVEVVGGALLYVIVFALLIAAGRLVETSAAWP